MKVVGLQRRPILSWHRTIHSHPIFNPLYARENLASLVGALFMLYMYLSVTVITLHLTVLYGFFESETLTWLIIETGARNIMLDAPDWIFYSKYYVILSLILAMALTAAVRHSFSIAKARLHPSSEKDLKRYLTKLKVPFFSNLLF